MAFNIKSLSFSNIKLYFRKQLVSILEPIVDEIIIKKIDIVSQKLGLDKKEPLQPQVPIEQELTHLFDEYGNFGLTPEEITKKTDEFYQKIRQNRLSRKQRNVNVETVEELNKQKNEQKKVTVEKTDWSGSIEDHIKKQTEKVKKTFPLLTDRSESDHEVTMKRWKKEIEEEKKRNQEIVNRRENQIRANAEMIAKKQASLGGPVQLKGENKFPKEPTGINVKPVTKETKVTKKEKVKAVKK